MNNAWQFFSMQPACTQVPNSFAGSYQMCFVCSSHGLGDSELCRSLVLQEKLNFLFHSINFLVGKSTKKS
jgi:hypothetical protein